MNMVVEATHSEDQLIQTARDAMNACNWVVGECAVHWTERYARGQSDAHFGEMVGLSADQVRHRRRVWEVFGASRKADTYPELRWSHFYTAVSWDEPSKYLKWANENEATVAEMRAWRRAQNGEDLLGQPEASEWGTPTPAANLDETSIPVEAKAGKTDTLIATPEKPPEPSPKAQNKEPESSGVSEARHIETVDDKTTANSPVEPNVLDIWKQAVALLNDLQERMDQQQKRKLATDLRREADRLDPPKKVAKKTVKFTPPTVAEVEAYVAEQEWNGFDADHFWNFYDSKGWMVGKTKMANWHSTASRAWKRGDGWCAKQGADNSKPTTFYEQRESNNNAAFDEVFGSAADGMEESDAPF